MNCCAEHYVVPLSPVVLADDYRPGVDVIFGQLLGLFFSLRWELKPDCPSPNSAISRVVQNVSHPLLTETTKECDATFPMIEVCVVGELNLDLIIVWIDQSTVSS
jgi:hypothetical protein